MKALIFGINGQDGFYLTQLLKNLNIEVFGVSRSIGPWIRGNVNDKQFVEKIIIQYKPDYVFHFAANSTTGHSAIFENHETISVGSLNILESIKNVSPASKVFLSGSAMQFKNNGQAIDENTEFDGSSPYSVDRIYTTYLARYYRNKFGLKVYIGYFFNHDSPLRTERHINQKIALFVKNISTSNSQKLTIGNLDVKKEFNFSGDLMNAVWLLINQDLIYEAVIGSGQAYSIKDWIDICFKLKDKNWNDYVVIDKNFIPEYQILLSNPIKIKSLNWNSIVSIKALAEMMILK